MYTSWAVVGNTQPDPHLFHLSTRISLRLHNWRSVTKSGESMHCKEQSWRTFKMGLKDEPDNVPQADGVKLWDPTYAQPAAGSTTWTSSSDSSSVSENSSSCRFLDENGLSCNIAIIIFVQIILEEVRHLLADGTFECINTCPPLLLES